ncbi:hypothetical protein [uncultured Thiodictyon sp.]|uniref:hypothetical protein n=1 Tax=uncultured Thiodictyon sp. TaxID=1846217 RepID=UPI0025F7DAAC|nr:hypothetical protein [uncultured Thiodictyon sp.]
MVPAPLLHLYPWTPSPPGTDSSASRSPTAQLPTGTLTSTPWAGVFDLRWGGRTIRLILLGEIAAHPRNAPWEVFSARLERVRRGLRNYHPRNPQSRGLLGQLYFHYRIEVPDMAYTMEEFEHDTRRLFIEHLHEFDSDEIQAIVEQLPLDARLRGLDPEERLRGLAAEERLRGLDAEERLRGLDPAVVEAWLKRPRH